MQYRSHRYPTEFPIDMRTPAGAQRATISDVNTQGARLTGTAGLQRGDKIGLNVLFHQIEAVVRWVNGDMVGISFRPQITEDQLDTLRYRRDARNVFRPGSVGYRHMELR